MDMSILTCIFFHFYLIGLDLWNAFCEVSPWGRFLFTLQRQKKVCTPGDEAIMKIHKKLFSGIPFNFTLFVISPKEKRIWSWNFGFAIRKIWAFIWYQKIYYFRLSPGGWECDQHKGKIQISLPNFAFFTVKSPGVTKRLVSEESAFKKSKNPSAFFPHKTIGSINSFIPTENKFRLLR